jgi:hypothetical protein
VNCNNDAWHARNVGDGSDDVAGENFAEGFVYKELATRIRG